MPYMLIFKFYLGGELMSEEWHYFSDLADLYHYAVVRLKFVEAENLYDRCDIQVEVSEANAISLAA